MGIIADRYQALQEAIQHKILSCGRKEEEVTLVAATKTHPPVLIQEAYQAGCRQFGENRVQEALAKMPLLPSDCHWRRGKILHKEEMKRYDEIISTCQRTLNLLPQELVLIEGQAKQQREEILRTIDGLYQIKRKKEDSLFMPMELSVKNLHKIHDYYSEIPESDPVLKARFMSNFKALKEQIGQMIVCCQRMKQPL